LDQVVSLKDVAAINRCETTFIYWQDLLIAIFLGLLDQPRISF
jgi:hypothetical protein